MIRDKIVIGKFALEEMLRASYETLMVESIGYLFGEQEKTPGFMIYNVESVHPIQLAKRKNEGAEYSASNRGDWTAFNQKIGRFHSHVESRCRFKPYLFICKAGITLSKEDKDYLREEKDRFEIAIAFNKAHRISKISFDPLLFSGYLRGKNQTYRFDIAGHSYTNNRITRAELYVPKELQEHFG
jgi:hypothetical protein